MVLVTVETRDRRDREGARELRKGVWGRGGGTGGLVTKPLARAGSGGSGMAPLGSTMDLLGVNSGTQQRL